jgi:hypothetical protein
MTEAALCARPINAAQTAVSGHASQAMAKPGKESVAVLRKAWYAIDEDARYQPRRRTLVVEDMIRSGADNLEQVTTDPHLR